MILLIVQRDDTRFDDIDLRRASSLSRAGMIGSLARTTRQSHPRQPVKPIDRALIRRDPRVAAIVVTIRPHAVRRRGVPGPAQVAHRPEARPEAGNLPVARERDTRFQPPAFEA